MEMVALARKRSSGSGRYNPSRLRPFSEFAIRAAEVALRPARIPITISLLVLTIAAACAQTPHPLTHKDFDSWRLITGQALSRDGKWLAYAYMDEDADGEVIVKNLATGKQHRIQAGNLSQPSIIPPADR